MTCEQCAGQGYVHVLSSSGRPFIGLCDCPSGAHYRRDMDKSPERLERRFDVSIDRIWPVADLRPSAAPSLRDKVAR